MHSQELGVEEWEDEEKNRVRRTMWAIWSQTEKGEDEM